MVSASAKEAPSSGVSIESVRIESRPCSKSLTTWSQGVILTTQFKWKVGCCWHFPCETRVNEWLSNEVLGQPYVSKFINLIPNHHITITRFNTHHKFGVDCIIRWNTTWKKTPCHHAGKPEGSGDLLLSLQSCMPHHIDGNGWGTVHLVAWNSSYSKQWKEQPLGATLVWATDHHQEAHLPVLDDSIGLWHS